MSDCLCPPWSFLVWFFSLTPFFHLLNCLYNDPEGLSCLSSFNCLSLTAGGREWACVIAGRCNSPQPSFLSLISCFIAVILLWSSQLSQVKLYTKGNTASFSIPRTFLVSWLLHELIPGRCFALELITYKQSFHLLRWSQQNSIWTCTPQVHSSSMMFFPWRTFFTDEKNHNKRAHFPSI